MRKVGDAIAHESLRVFHTTSVRLTAVIAVQLAETESLSEGTKLLPVVGQTLGFVVGEGVSGSISCVTLKKMLQAHKVISKTSLKVLSAMQKEYWEEIGDERSYSSPV